jgi:hypothetical protein
VHRRIVTRAAPEVARIGTTEGGVSVSSEPRRVAADLVPYATDKGRRLVAKLRQVRRGTPLSAHNPDHPGLIPAARRSPEFARAVERLLDAGVLATADFPDRYVGRVLTLGMLFERLDEGP